MFKQIQLPISLILIITLSISCEREFDSPPINEIAAGELITIEELRTMHAGQDLKLVDGSIYGVITMDESTGNLYKEAYVQDATAGILLRFTSTSGLYEGDSVRIDLTGAILQSYNMMLQLDSLDADRNIFKQATQQDIAPQLVTLTNLLSNGSNYQAQLIKLENVEFICDDLGKTYADASNQQSGNLYLKNGAGLEILVRTSGYANFANETIPNQNGSVIAVVSQYSNDIQLLIRRPGEIIFNNDREDDCNGNNGDNDPGGTTLLSKDFDDQSVTSGGWSNILVSGPTNCEWGIYAGNNSAAKATNYNDGVNSACESWLISPSIDLSGTSPLLSFRNTYNFAGDPLQVFVSTNYSGGDPSSANWTEITSQATWSTGNFSWESSGDINLTPYATNNVHIGFKYIGSNSDGSTWELDDITIINNQ